MKSLLVLVATFTMLQFAYTTHALVLSDGSTPSFIGNDNKKIVLKLDKAITDRMSPLVMRRGRSGLAELDRLLQKFDAESLVRQFPGSKMRMYRGRRIDLSGWHVIKFKKEMAVEKVAEAFKKISGVIDAQPIGIHAVNRLPNDPFLPDQWHLDRTSGPDIAAPEAWDFETGRADIVVAVLDTGVRWFHKDLGGSNSAYFEPPGFEDTIYGLHGADGNIWLNSAEIGGTIGADDDNNGFVDDMIGWDFVGLSLLDALAYCWQTEDCLFEDNDPRDFHGHGTHVAGIVSAMNNNDYAVASPAGGWGDGIPQPAGNGVKIMALRIGWSYTSPEIGLVSMEYAAQAFRYAADNGAHFVNCSWGSSNSGGLADAIDYYLATGGLIFKAAGNSNTSEADYMGLRDDIINVAATAKNDCKASFSNFGAWIDISAPGVDIWSTFNDGFNPDADIIASLSGTSMASPLALSIAASVWSQNPSWHSDQVKLKLFDATDDIDGLSCNSDYTGLLGAGRLNAYLALGSCEGDINDNGVVDGRDLAILISQFNCSTDCVFDLTYDDVLDESDLSVFVKDFTRFNCP
jgi:subtilisin family serine protease